MIKFKTCSWLKKYISLKITCSETLGNSRVSTSWIFTVPSSPNTASRFQPLSRRGRLWALLLHHLPITVVWWRPCGRFVDPGDVTVSHHCHFAPLCRPKRTGAATPAACPGPRKASRSLPWPLALGILWHPACLCAQVYSWWIRFPPNRRCRALAKPTDKLFSAARLEWGGGGRPERGPCALARPGCRLQLLLEYERGRLSALRSFLNAKECRKLPDQLVNQWQLQ